MITEKTKEKCDNDFVKYIIYLIGELTSYIPFLQTGQIKQKLKRVSQKKMFIEKISKTLKFIRL